MTSRVVMTSRVEPSSLVIIVHKVVDSLHVTLEMYFLGVPVFTQWTLEVLQLQVNRVKVTVSISPTLESFLTQGTRQT